MRKSDNVMVVWRDGHRYLICYDHGQEVAAQSAALQWMLSSELGFNFRDFAAVVKRIDDARPTVKVANRIAPKKSNRVEPPCCCCGREPSQVTATIVGQPGRRSWPARAWRWFWEWCSG